MKIAEMVLEYLKVALSTPVVVGAIVVLLFCKFKSDISALMGRIGKITLPGGGELSMSQRERTANESGGETPPVPSLSEVDLPQGLTLSPEQVREVQQVIAGERANACLWEYRFLNYHLVIRTQRVLDWLASVPSPPTILLFDNLLQHLPTEERAAIIGTLQSHHLVDLLNGELLKVTPKGYDYIAWRGPLPDLPQPSKS